MKYITTKRYGHERGYSIAYRQYLADSHCSFIHGYSLAFHLEFESETIDVRNWCVDYGSLKTFKHFLDDHFDHKFLAVRTDPHFSKFEELHKLKVLDLVEVEKTGCEGLSEFLYNYLNDIWLPENGYRSEAHSVWCRKVTVFETPENSSSVEGHRPADRKLTE